METTAIKTAAEKKSVRLALAGNPNCGKTTLFNQLTGSNQYVGNWPGVTVEKKEGKVKSDLLHDIRIIDLPGIYSLSPYSPEEIISRNCLIADSPDIIVNIVDATNLERNLYLTTQLAELSRPMVIALNMVDALKKQGDTVDCELLSKKLNIPVIPISASHGTGIEELIKKITEIADFGADEPMTAIYSEQVEQVLLRIEDALCEVDPDMENKRWNAVKLFEGDHVTWRQFEFTKSQREHITFHIEEIKTSKNIDREMIIADQRYKFICKICEKAVKRRHRQGHITLSDKVDRIVTNKYLALPLFFLLMFLVFEITFGQIGSFFQEKAEWLLGEDMLTGGVRYLLTAAGASGWAHSLIEDGIIAGLGAVISFLPQVSILFFLLSILEDSGYMARAAFIMDKLLRAIGLSGRAFVPMLMGFGCSVPAILGTRTLENEKDKRLTILITPFMSCSAKMPVYLLFISVFFKNHSPAVIFSIYFTGIVVAILTALIFKNTLLRGKPAPFVMELPPYRMPSPKTLGLHVWERVKDFLTRAGTLILGATVVIWFLQSFDFNLNLVDSQDSILASVGKLISPIFTACGFGDWRASVSLLTGLIAKESVVSTMTVLYGAGGIAGAFTQISAFSFLIFVLLYTPCIAAISAIHKEMNSKKWTFITIVYQIAAAWLASTVVYTVGSLVI